MPIISTIAAIAGVAAAGSGVAGAVEGAQAGGRQQKALSIQEQIAQQEAADKQQSFKQLIDFFTPYLKSGSPFLQNIQSAAAGQNAQQTNNAAGQFREQMQSAGTGFGPSGSTAAGLANIGSAGATAGASNYLQNLLANEQVKFQAAQGIQGAGSMAGSSQNQPNVSAQLPYQSLGSGLSGLSGVLANLLKNPSAPASNVPNSAQNFPIPGVPGSSGTPVTGGISV